MHHMLIDDTESQTDKLKTAAPSTTETVQTFISLSVFSAGLDEWQRQTGFTLISTLQESMSWRTYK